jgi:hypothetical protein
VRLEPVVAAIAEKHNLVARVWNDESERHHGKTASSWVALARKREHLGDRLCSPIGDLFDPRDQHGREQLIDVIKRTYPDIESALEKNANRTRDLKDLLKDGKDLKDFKEPEKRETKALLLELLEKKDKDPQALQFAAWIRKTNSEFTNLMEVLHMETGYGFRPVKLDDDVEAWTDDYADVMRVMMIEELQKVRKFFGLPTPGVR